MAKILHSAYQRVEYTGLKRAYHYRVRVAEVGSLSAEVKMATKVFVRRVYAIFATDSSFLRAIANL